MLGLRQRKDPPTDSEKLTNTIAYAAPDGNLWRIGEDHPSATAVIEDVIRTVGQN